MTTMVGLYVEFKAKAEQIDKAFNKMQGDFNKLKANQSTAAQGFTNMGSKISTAFKAIAAAFVFKQIFDGFSNLISKINETQDSIDGVTDAARGLGILASDLQSIAFAGKLSGVELASIELILKKMSISVANASDGNADLQKSFSDLGLSLETVRNLSPKDQLDAITGALSGVQDKTKQTSIAFNIFGKSMTDALNLTRDGFGANISLADKLGLALSDSQRRAVDSFGDAKLKITAIWEGMWQKITAYVSPAFATILNGLTDMIVKFGGVDDVAQTLAKAIVSGVETAVRALDGIITFMDSLYVRMLKFRQFALETVNKAEKFNIGQAVGEKVGLLEQGGGAERQYNRTAEIGRLGLEIGAEEKRLAAKSNVLSKMADSLHKAGESIVKIDGRLTGALEGVSSVLNKAAPAITTFTDSLVSAAAKLVNTQLGQTLGLNQEAGSSTALDQNIQNIYLTALKGSKPATVTALDENGNLVEMKNTYERMIEALNKQAVSTFQNDPASLTKYLSAIKDLQEFTKNIDPKDQKITVDINVSADTGLKASVATSTEVANAIIATVTKITAEAASRGAR